MLTQINQESSIGQVGATTSLGMKLRAQKEYLRAAASELQDEMASNAEVHEKGGA